MSQNLNLMRLNFVNSRSTRSLKDHYLCYSKPCGTMPKFWFRFVITRSFLHAWKHLIGIATWQVLQLSFWLWSWYSYHCRSLRMWKKWDTWSSHYNSHWKRDRCGPKRQKGKTRSLWTRIVSSAKCSFGKIACLSPLNFSDILLQGVTRWFLVSTIHWFRLNLPLIWCEVLRNQTWNVLVGGYYYFERKESACVDFSTDYEYSYKLATNMTCT